MNDEYVSLNLKPSDFFKFCEGLKGYDVYLNDKKMHKWELFHYGKNEETRKLISSRKHPHFKYVEKTGWLNGSLIFSEE